jgi:site-specific DNA-methyltransferase (adenine-specific)
MKIDDILNTVIHDDCLNVMKQLPDKCIDLVLTDPPYGINEDGASNHSRGHLAAATKFDKKSWDKTKPSKEYFNEMQRIGKNQIIFGGNYFIEYLRSTPCFLVWDKDNGNSDFADCELAWCSFNSAVRKFKFRWHGMLQENMMNKEKRLHPTQKPVSLFQWILQNYSEPGMTIFDPFSGSGTTAIACLETGRNYILIEKEPDYIDIIINRIELWKEQGRMF